MNLLHVFPILALAFLAPAPGIWAQDSHPATDYPDFRRIVQDAKSMVFPAVVYVRCVRDTFEGGKKESHQVSGSGVIISPTGEVLTNWHVIDKATSVRCLLSDGRHATATIVGSDKDTDLALLQLDMDAFAAANGAISLPYAALGDSSVLSEGDFVMAMGAPWGLNRSVTIGIVSCISRYIEGYSEYSLWIQTDAPINPGNSGGPLVNTTGEVVGINALGLMFADGMGFAIPAEAVQILLPQLREHGRVNWSWSGVQLQPLNDFDRDIYFDADEGVIVAETDPESPARRAGLQSKDRIITINGERVTARTHEDLPAMRRRLGLLPIEAEAILEVVRTGAGDPEETITVTLTPREKGEVQGDELELKRFDFTIKTINQFDNPELFFHRQKGIFVHGVRWPGNAGNAGLLRGDIILKIDGRDMGTLDDAEQIHKELIDNLERRSRIVLVVLRKGLMRQLVLDFARDYSRE